MKRKDYHRDPVPQRADTLQVEEENPWIVETTSILDFRRWQCHRETRVHAERDDLLKTMATCLRRLTTTRNARTIKAIFQSSLQVWFEFLDIEKASLPPVHRIADLNRPLLDQFINWLTNRPSRTETGRLSYATTRSIYGGLRTVLAQCVLTGQLSMDCFPRRPFPDVARTYKSHQPYTKEEMQALMFALARDLRAIKDGAFDGNESDRLLVYFLLVAARTGRNPTALYEMERDAVQPHPLKPDTHCLLTTYKRRGNSVSIQSFQKPQPAEHISMLTADTTALIRDLLTMTSDLVDEAPTELRNRLWLYRRGHRKDLGPVGLFSIHMFMYCAERFVERHGLLAYSASTRSENAPPLRITIMRLRKTFASRMWELTGGDVVTTANLLGNKPQVTDTHYLAVTPDMLRNHHFLGKCLEAELRGTTDDAVTLASLAEEMRIGIDDVKRILKGENNTGVGRCSSPFQGRYAPKDGRTACSAFLYCFRCPNQVVMESDLYRLYSFYWLLVKERNLIGRNQWHKIYGWVVREIDKVIASQFPPHKIREAKEKALTAPHPMWRDRSMLLAVGHA
ncbi:integrase [Paraburkholderia sp. J41]|uniref:integrase n=1 Tax=Paraburkholderia sp. J41 TaxID=2805433 RepID=UPI002AC34F70|nr:integrase [Paraburkholderia sp. J41]